MKYNGKIYFGWSFPLWRGIVYEVDPKAVGLSSIVRLPDGTELQLTMLDDTLQVTETSSRNRGEAVVFEATLVFDTKGEPPVYDGEWEKLLWKISAAAAVNSLFSVILTSEEYERLSVNNNAEFEKLKEKMSPRASSLVMLLEPGMAGSEGQPELFLCRTGRCP